MVPPKFFKSQPQNFISIKSGSFFFPLSARNSYAVIKIAVYESVRRVLPSPNKMSTCCAPSWGENDVYNSAPSRGENDVYNSKFQENVPQFCHTL